MSASMIACLSAAYAWSRKLTLAESGRSVRGIVPAPAGMLATRPVLAFGCAGDAGPPAYISYIPKTTGRVENAILAETTHAFSVQEKSAVYVRSQQTIVGSAFNMRPLTPRGISNTLCDPRSLPGSFATHEPIPGRAAPPH